MKEKIIKVIEDVLMLPSGSITESTKVEDIAEWDSLAHVMIIGELEQQLGIYISLEDAIQISGVDEIFKKAGI